MQELTEEILRGLSAVRRQQPSGSANGEGSDRGGHVRLTVGRGGILACSADPGWACRQDGDAVTAALMQALQAAKNAAAAVVDTTGANLGGLVRDALATLQATTTRGGRAR